MNDDDDYDDDDDIHMSSSSSLHLHSLFIYYLKWIYICGIHVNQNRSMPHIYTCCMYVCMPL